MTLQSLTQLKFDYSYYCIVHIFSSVYITYMIIGISVLVILSVLVIVLHSALVYKICRQKQFSKF